MVRMCAIKTCKQSKEKHGVSLHKVKPSWFRNVTILNKSCGSKIGEAWQPSKHSVICSDHFVESDFDNTYLSKKKLGITVVPTLKSEAVPRLCENESKIPEVDIDNDESSCPEPNCQKEPECQPEPKCQPTNKCYTTSSTSTALTTTLSYSVASCSSNVVWAQTTPIFSLQTKSVPSKSMSREDEQQPNIVEPPKKCQKPKLYASKGTQTKKDTTVKTRSMATQTEEAQPPFLTSTPKRHKRPLLSTPKRLKGDSITPNTTFTSGGREARDSTYVPSDEELDDTFETQDYRKKPSHERKFIVFEWNLLSLFTICQMCSGSTNAVIRQVMGTFISIYQDCSCGWSRTWNSQPFIGNMPAGNLLLSASILFSGCSPSKVLRVLNHAKIQTINVMTFFNHQKGYLIPTINKIWERRQNEQITKLRQRGPTVGVGGDGRADSPGHSAKYGSYTMIHLESGKVLDIQLVQSNEVNGSNNMEKEGLIRAIDFFHQQNVTIDTIVTDRHLQIQKWVRENLTEARHYYDVWHVAKGIKKKLQAIAKTKGAEDVGPWIRSISNHLYWSAASTPDGDEMVMLSKWKSVANHVQDIHTNHDGPFKNCCHGEIVTKKWLKPSTFACSKVEDLITNTRLCTAVKKLSPIHQTSHLEAYHSVVNQFAPKMFAFSFYGLYARLKLAALHFNENINRPDALTRDGYIRCSLTFPKFKKGESTVRVLKTDQTFDYVSDLMSEVCEVGLLPFKQAKVDATPEFPAPPPLCSKFVRPDKH